MSEIAEIQVWGLNCNISIVDSKHEMKIEDFVGSIGRN